MTCKCPPHDGTPSSLKAKVTFLKPVTIIGKVNYIADPDGKITHISILTNDRDEPSLIPFEGTLVEPLKQRKWVESEVPSGDRGV